MNTAQTLLIPFEEKSVANTDNLSVYAKSNHFTQNSNQNSPNICLSHKNVVPLHAERYSIANNNMNLDSQSWKEIDLNVDSLWIMGPRARGGKRENNYHGNFAPQIPNEMIQRYTNKGDVVLDMFMGSGTTLFECETLNRNYIGFDINEDIIQYVQNKMQGDCPIEYFINNCDICDTNKVQNTIVSNLKDFKKQSVDLIISHPPYLDIVKFTDKKEDLSQISDLSEFVDMFVKSVSNVWLSLKKKGTFVLVVGDAYKYSEVVPLGFHLMNAIQQNFKCLLKGIVVKDIVGNRGKIGTTGIHRYRALKFGYYIFKHEYVFVFQKK